MRGNLSIRNIIIVLAAVAIAVWIDLPNNPGISFIGVEREISTHLGLDLVGGTQTLLEADLPEDAEIDLESMQAAKDVVERRVNGLGVSEAVVQLAGDRRILVELPGVDDPEEAIVTIKETALLEFVDFSTISQGNAINLIGSQINTDFSSGDTGEEIEPGVIFETIMTGAQLSNVGVGTDEANRYVVQFELTPEGAQIFSDFTGSHVGQILAIVLDKVVISAPEIQGQIPGGAGIIQGNFTAEEANNLAIQLRYGALPIPLTVVETRTVGPSLGQDSLDKSLIAGAIGLGVVMTFMVLYYRLPGLIADIAILIYIAITYALFRTIPVTLTLAGFAGLILSTGSALDANILIFERLKEELRSGKNLSTSFELSWKRAWPSIRDSNFATLITCVILFWFGSSFGATIVVGFAVTLFIGVIVSLFTAISATRILLDVAIRIANPKNLPYWFGT